MKPAVYPDSFFVAHRLFTGSSFPEGGVWGDILDGPVVDTDELAELIIEAFKSDETGPTRENLRVWAISPGKIAEEWTAWTIEHVRDTLAARRS